jgi:RES domain-containing protein
MPRVYRLLNKKYAKDPSDMLAAAEGARLHGGRWSHKGTAVIYACSHVSLAVLELLVHSAVLPKNMVLIAYDVPDAPPAGDWPHASLPTHWATYPFTASTQDLGTQWARDRSELARKVPSAVVPAETNWLLNPLHPGISSVKASLLGPFPFDPRLRP